MFVVLRLVLTVLSWLPLSVLHLLSDFVAVLLAHVVRYRYSTITSNLRKCFPEWDENRLAEVRWQFYRHFADVIVEIIKVPAISAEELQHRCRFEGPNPFVDSFHAGKNVSGFAYHLGNWEWFAMSTKFRSNHDYVTVYKPLSDRDFDTWIRGTRERYGQILLSFKKIRDFVHNHKRPFVMGLASDQRPHKLDAAIEVEFFGMRTAFFPGPALLAIQHGWDSISGSVQKEGRSKYVWTAEKIFPAAVDPEKESAQISRLCEKHSITSAQAIQCIGLIQAYAANLEKCIRKQPHIWLWSHRRWK